MQMDSENSDSKEEELKKLSEEPTTRSTSSEPQLLKLRVQNVCCGKEAVLVKDQLKGKDGIISVNFNIIGRIAFIKHNPSLITGSEIIEILNALHLGISLMECGTHSAEQEYKEAKRKIALLALSAGIQTTIFIAVIVATADKQKWDKWVSIPVLVIGGAPMLYKAYNDFKNCVLANVNLLMLIAVAGTIALGEWLDGCLIVYIFSLAELLLQICYFKVDKSLSALLVSAPSTAVLAENNKTVGVEGIEIGTLILVCAGEQIPLDGKVIEGIAAVDESSITGEAVPVNKETDSNVFSGTIIQSGYLKIETTSDHKSSTISRVSDYIEEAKAASSNTEDVLNRFAKFYTPFIVVAGLVTFLIPFTIGKVREHQSGIPVTESQISVWLMRALKILVVACPCSLIIAVPITMISGISRAAKDGILIRGAQFLERMSTIQMFCFDKTGTLTEGRFQVVREKEVYGDRNEAIKYAAALETKSSHPVAAAVVSHFSGCITDQITEYGSQINLPEVQKFKNESGMGLSGVVNDKRILVGNKDLMALFNVEMNDSCQDCEIQMCNDCSFTWTKSGCTVIFISIDEKLCLVLRLEDKLRDSSKQTITRLHDNNVRTVMLTGDSEGPARTMSKEAGLKEFSFSMKPHEKFQWLQSKQKNDGLKVAMVGDGINDCPSLAAADVGIAIGPTATGLAVDSAGITLMSDDLSRIVDLLLLAKFCRIVVYQNIVGSILIKVIFVAIALSKNGLLWLAILADVTGLLFVILNGLRPFYR